MLREPECSWPKECIVWRRNRDLDLSHTHAWYQAPFYMLQQVMHEILVELEFTSDRARMSVVARAPDGTIRLLTKGSDAVRWQWNPLQLSICFVHGRFH